MESKVTVQGDADGGWIVEVNDGDHVGVYSPEEKDAKKAEKAALAMHADAYPPPAPPVDVAALVAAEVEKALAAAKT